MIPYGTLEGATVYHAALGNEAWSAADKSDAQRSAALLRGSRALDGRYGSLFPGQKSGGYAQARAWPRTGAYNHCAQEEIPTNIVPSEIEYAAYELALIELVEAGSTTPTLNLGRLTKSESVDGAASRSFFSPQEMMMLTPGSILDGFRPTLLTVSDLLGCYLRPANSRWVATVV